MKIPSTQVKICGITNLADARAALEAGADYLGFVLYAKSPRHIAPAALRRVLDRLRADARVIVVAVNARRALIEKLAQDCRLHAVQLHGSERLDDWMDLPLPIWRAFHLQNGASDPDPAQWPAARYVLDAFVPGRYGGTGQTADWKIAARLAKRMPLMLAGGLNPQNVAAAIRQVRPLGVDTAGGVEAAPGRKDRRKLEDFIKAVRTQS